MMKKLLALSFLFILVGCQRNENISNETNAESNVTSVESGGGNVEGEATSQSQATEPVKFPKRAANIPLAWTNYSAYAKPNEEGFAYEIVADPTISSSIKPLNDSSEQVVLFTFDDAPQTPGSHALEMARLMKEKDVNAIFLVNGMYLESEENIAIIRQVHEMGFEIGNHTQTHADQQTLTYEEKYAEIKTTNDKIEAITGTPVRWFRPPFGSYDKDTIAICNELNLQLMLWSFGYDWMDEYLEGNALAQISLTTDYLYGGANILMHDRSWTYEALGAMIDGYRAQGYQIVDPYLIKHQQNIVKTAE